MYIQLKAFVFILLVTVAFGLNADTLLKVKIKKCQRDGVDEVVCDFKIKASVSDSMTLTGGEHSQAVDGDGKAYNSIEVAVETIRGPSIVFKIFRGSQWKPGQIRFAGVGPEVNEFKIMTMLFNDGSWTQEKTVTISPE